jgi:hypothetical protein
MGPKNYLISSNQFKTILNLFESETKVTLSTKGAMLRLISFLQEKEYSPENIVDVILQLRYKDEFTIQFTKMLVGKNQDLIDAIDKIIETS